MRYFISIFLLVALAGNSAHASCTNPEGSMGAIIFNKAHKVMQYCNGDDWIGIWGGGGGGSLPAGAVMAFDLAECPNGWSPMVSAQGRFLVGTGGGYNLGSAGGANTVALTEAQLPAHNHTGTAASAGAHTHTGTAASAGAHTHSGTTNSAGNHRHETDARGGSMGGTPGIGTENRHKHNSETWRWTSYAGDHTHSFTTNSAGAHTHALTINSAGAHTHSLTINNTGSGQAHENRPPYLALLYCRKD